MMDDKRDEAEDDEAGCDGVCSDEAGNDEGSGNGVFQLHDGAFPAGPAQFYESVNVIADLQKSIDSIYQSLAPSVLEQVNLATRTMNALVAASAFSAIKNSMAATLSRLTPSIESLASEINTTFERVVGNVRYIAKLQDSCWPLYLVDSEALIEEIRSLPDLSDESLETEVTAIALAHLDEAWVEETKKRWASFEMLDEGEFDRLSQALDYHLRGDYDACVAILMCMIEGLIVKLNPGVNALDAEDVAWFNAMAEDFNVSELPENGRRDKRRFYAKDHVLITIMNAENGWFTWQAAGMYINEVVLANSYDPAIAASNPLRNKICHGYQTNYGTKIHSLKSILAVDIVLRLGNVARFG